MPHNSKLDSGKPIRSWRNTGRVRIKSPSAPPRRTRILNPVTNDSDRPQASNQAGHPFPNPLAGSRELCLQAPQTGESEEVDPLAAVLRSCIQTTTMQSPGLK